MTYSECCKILDRSARNKLTTDKRPFDERFRSAIKESKSELDNQQLKLIYEWIKGSAKKISDIFSAVACIIDNTEIYNILPECFLSLGERFGYLIFIKYLVDQKIIKLID